MVVWMEIERDRMRDWSSALQRKYGVKTAGRFYICIEDVELPGCFLLEKFPQHILLSML